MEEEVGTLATRFLFLDPRRASVTQKLFEIQYLVFVLITILRGIGAKNSK